MTKAKIEKWTKEGRGKYGREGYKGWLTIKDVASLGRSHRMLGTNLDRPFDLLSDLERNYYLILEYSNCVIDVKAQYPLLYLEETIAIAEDLNIKHPFNPQTREPNVLTTDFLITIEINGSTKNIARTCKYRDALNDKDQMEKFQIEQEYWQRKNIDWGIVTELQVNKTVAQNLITVRQFHDLSVYNPFKKIGPQQTNGMVQLFLNSLSSDVSVRNTASEFEDRMMLPPGTGISIFKHLVKTKKIYIDLAKPLDIDNPCKIQTKVKGSELIDAN